MPNIGKSVGNEKAAELLRDEEDNSVEPSPAPTAGQALENASETVVEKGVSATSTEVKVEPFKDNLKEGSKEFQNATNRATKTRKQAPKTVAPQNLEEVYMEKIAMIRYIKSIIVPEIDLESTSTKAGRELVIEVQRAVETLKNEYLLKIQNL